MQKEEAQEKQSTYNHIIKYIGLFGGVQGLNLLASVVRNKLVSVILGPSGLGLISLYNTAAGLLGSATNFGLSMSAVRNISELHERGDKEALKDFVKVVRSWSCATALLGVIVCCLSAPLLSLAYFDDTDKWFSFVCLSPVVGLAALSGGELAILKGVRLLKMVAVQSTVNSLCAIALTVPLYYLWGERAIVLSLVLLALLAFSTTIYFSHCKFPFSFPFGKEFSLAKGKNMVKLGTAFILAGVLTSGVEFIIRAYMMQVSTEAEVGLYNAGYLVTVTYASMVFVAMETDFFPRLSAVNNNVLLSNDVVNKQIEMSVLLISPLLVAFLVFLPILLPLLYSSSFLPVVAMAQCAVFSMYMRAVSLPIAYLSLAKGRSWIFLFAEAVYDAAAVLFIILGYTWGGLRGTGIALSLAALFDVLLIWGISRRFYGFRFSAGALKMFSLQLPLGVAAFVISVSFTGWKYWIFGCVFALVSAAVSLYFLHKNTTMLQGLWVRLKKLLHKKKQ